MEEILASIRRIISEDEKPSAEQKAEEAPTDDVLDLTEIVEDAEESVADEPEEPEAVSEPEETAVSEPEEPEEPESEAEAEAVETAGVIEEAAEVEETAEAAEEIDFDAEIEDDTLELREAEPDEEAVAEPPEDLIEEASLPVEEETSSVPDDGGLVGVSARDAATGSLASLVHAVDQAKGGATLGDGNRTIEDLVKEVMRPMIREWLDQNLPGLVERLVRKEIERLSRTAEGDD